MWFADVGLGLAWIMLAGWMLVAGLAVTVGRAALSTVVPRSARVPLSVGTAATVVLFAVQAGLVDTVEDRAGSGWLDQSVWVWFVGHRAPAATTVMTAVSAAGGTAGMAVLALIGAGLLWRMRRRAEAGIVLGAAVGAGLLVEGFKHLYGRARPPVIDRLTVETNFALPSGHALGSIVVLGVLAAVAVLLSRRFAVQATAVALAIVGIVTIGVSRLYLGVHWVTDVLTGWLLGGAWLALCVTTLVLIQRRPQPAPASTPAPNADPTTRGDGDGAAIPATARCAGGRLAVCDRRVPRLRGGGAHDRGGVPG
jgi:undecaprenyl-diphosphatase